MTTTIARAVLSLRALIFPVLLLYLCGAVQAQVVWERTSGPGGGPVLTVLQVGAATIAGTVAGFYRSSDGGQTWTWSNEGVTFAAFRQVRDLDYDGTRVWGATNGGLFTSTDGGLNWTAVTNTGATNSSFQDVFVTGGSVYVANGSGGSGGLFRTDDGGASWANVSGDLATVSGRAFATAVAVEGTDIYAATNNRVYRSEDSGTTWAEVGGGLPATPFASEFAVLGANVFVSLSNSNGVYRLPGGGDTWTALNDDFPAGFSNGSKFTVVGTDLYVALSGSGGGLFRSTDNGDNWTAISAGVDTTDMNQLVVNGTELVAASTGGVYRSTDGGLTWAKASTGLAATRVNALLATGGTLHAGTESSGTARSTDRGATWVPFESGLDRVTMRVTALAELDGILYAGTGGGGVMASGDGGATWTARNTDLNNVSVDALAVLDGVLYAGNLMGVSRYDAVAMSWTDWSTGLGTSTQHLTTRDGNLYAGTGIGVFESVGGANNWTAVNNGLANLNIRSLANTQFGLFAGTGDDRLYRSDDNGQTWMDASDVLNQFADTLAVVEAGNTLIAAQFFGATASSTDGGDNWVMSDVGLENFTWVQSLAYLDGDVYAGVNAGGVFATRGVVDLIAPVTTATPAPGPYTASQFVVLACTDENSGCVETRYTTDGTDPTTSGTAQVFDTQVVVSANTTLRFFSTDDGGNAETPQTVVYVIDSVEPVVTATPPGGVYAGSQMVSLSCTDDNSGCGTIRYTLDTTDPRVSGTAQNYTAPVAIAANTPFWYAADDLAGNSHTVAVSYTIDSVAPVTTATPAAGSYEGSVTVTLNCSDDNSGCAATRYNTDGSDPTTSATALDYTAGIDLAADALVRFFSTDAAGNAEAVQSADYVIDDSGSSSSALGAWSVLWLALVGWWGWRGRRHTSSVIGVATKR